MTTFAITLPAGMADLFTSWCHDAGAASVNWQGNGSVGDTSLICFDCRSVAAVTAGFASYLATLVHDGIETEANMIDRLAADDEALTG